MNNSSDWVIVGRFGRPQGLKGLIRVISFTEPESAILDYQSWHVLQKKTWIPVKRVHSEIQNRAIMVRVDGYLQREELAVLTNAEIGVLREQLPVLSNEGEYYWHDLLHMQVRNQEGQLLGNVTQIMPTGANDVLVVEGDNKRHLIPYILKIYIISVDLPQKQMIVNWDEQF